MKMFALIADVVVVLTLAIIVLSVLVLLNRYFSDLREARLRRIRQDMQEQVNALQADQADLQTVIRALRYRKDIALNVLIETASRMPRDERKSLRALFEHFQFPQQAIKMLRARRWALRMRAATKLGYMGEDNAIPELVRSLDDEMLDVRLAAAHALSQMGAVQAVRPILRALSLSAAWPLQRSTEILYNMGPAVIDPLIDYLREQSKQSQDSSVVVVIRVLGMLHARQAASLVSSFLTSPNPELRLSSAKALGVMGDKQSVLLLCKSLDDPAAWEVRSAIAQALGKLGDTAAITPLEQRLSDPAWWTRFNAAESLYQLGPAGQQSLKTAMKNHADAFARDISRQILEEHGVIAPQTVVAT